MASLRSLLLRRDDTAGEYRLIVENQSGTLTFQWSKTNWSSIIKIGSSETEMLIRAAVAEALGKDERNLTDEEIARRLNEECQ
jgi:hypothetical protein